MKRITLFIMAVAFTIFFNSLNANAQKGIEILFQGRTLLESTGKPIGTPLRFINPEAKTIFCRSNSIDGIFQTVLPSGITYYLFIKDYVLADGGNKIDIPYYSKYEELDKDIYLKPIVHNMVLFNVKVFEPNEHIVINADFIKILKDFMDVNSGMKIEVEVSSYDSWFANTKKAVTSTNKKGKQVTKKVTVSSKEQLSDLLDLRVNAIKDELKKHKIFLKENAYKKDLKVVDAKKKMLKKEIPGKKKKYETYLPDMENLVVRTVK